jgi:hypothetical protein
MSGPPAPPPPPIAPLSQGPPPSWTPPAQTHTWGSLPGPHRGPTIELWPFLGLWLRAGGFLLLFLGTLIAVLGATPGGGCYTNTASCGTGFFGQAANALLIAKILWVLGLGGLGAGAGIRLHWGIHMPLNPSADETTWLLAARRANWTLLILSVVLLLVLLLVSSLWLSGVPFA